jgi:hypothetical protein
MTKDTDYGIARAREAVSQASNSVADAIRRTEGADPQYGYLQKAYLQKVQELLGQAGEALRTAAALKE